MSTARPHSAVVAAHLSEYLRDLEQVLGRSIRALPTNQQFRAIFKASTAAFAVLERFRRRDLSLVEAAAGVSRRIPLLIACRQISLSYVELRRFVELAIWYPYFKEHPVEWEAFRAQPAVGIITSLERPIYSMSHREIGFYSSYLKERFQGESSKLPVRSVESLRRDYGDLSVQVHGRYRSVAEPKPSRAFDAITSVDLEQLAVTHKRILGAGCVIFASMQPAKISRLPAVERALVPVAVGTAGARIIRSGSFCAS